MWEKVVGKVYVVGENQIENLLGFSEKEKLLSLGNTWIGNACLGKIIIGIIVRKRCRESCRVFCLGAWEILKSRKHCSEGDWGRNRENVRVDSAI